MFWRTCGQAVCKKKKRCQRVVWARGDVQRENPKNEQLYIKTARYTYIIHKILERI